MLPGALPVGQILSAKLTDYAQSSLSKKAYDTSNTNVLVMGGAQGAHTIFEALEKVIQEHDT